MNENITHIFKWNNCEFHIVNGVLHREGAPAVITEHSQEWYLNGVHHRDDGPARMDKRNNYCLYYIKGELVGQGKIIDEIFNKYWIKEII